MIGKQLAHYEILSLLGEGGMGAVYRARDSKLGREVAIKVLPPELSEDPERIARFEREARVLASFHHPNIAAIHGFEEADGVRFLVMELVEGEDLSSRLNRGPLAVDEALGLARQIAEGLEAAHERNTVHRDLKPANLLLGPDGTIKILDFGLARAGGAPGDDPDLENSPTITAAMTQAGTILGTVAYMSPEQARGKAVDKRADIWAFGVIVVEMLTGGRLFEGETVSDTMASVLKTEVDLDALPAGVPAHVKALLSRCLDRDPATRLRDIGEARVALGQKGQPVAETASGGRGPSRWIYAAAGVLGGLLLGLLPSGLLDRAPEAPVTQELRFEIPLLRPDPSLYSAFDPAGERLVYTDAGQLWMRRLNDHVARPIPNTEGATHVTWSPDGQWLAFARGVEVHKIQPDGSRQFLVVQLPDPIHPLAGSLSWGQDDRFVIVTGDRGLLQVSTSGGSPEMLLEPAEGELDFHSASLLPGGKGVLFSPHTEAAFNSIELYDEAGRKTLHTHAGSGAIFWPQYSQGHVLYGAQDRNAGIWALPYSIDDREATGPPVLLAPEGRAFALSRQGHLAYIESLDDAQADLLLVDREGQTVQAVAEGVVGLNSPADISPDGRQLVVTILGGEDADIWLYDLESGERQRFVFGEENQYGPAWSPDGRQLLFARGDLADRRAWVRDLESGRETMLGDMPAAHFDFAPDGKRVAFGYQTLQLDWNLGAIELAGGEMTVLAQTLSTESDPAISPDGNYIAYQSDETGQPEIYLQRFPEGEERWRVSREGGEAPFWSASGDALYFRDGTELMEVGLRTAPRLVLGEARGVFELPGMYWVGAGRGSGEFLVMRGVELDSGQRGIVVWVGWGDGM